MYLVWAVLILVSVTAYPQLMLFMICLGYTASGLLEKGWELVRFPAKRDAGANTQQPLSHSKE
jgi:hypothetical protein